MERFIMSRNQKNIAGKKFGRLTAIRPTDRRGPGHSIVWQCQCECGSLTEVSVSYLTSGNTKSCGCLKKELQAHIRNRLHVVDDTCIEWLEGRKRRTDNKTGHPGIFRRNNGKYAASIGFKKKIYHIGTFEGYEEAVAAREAAHKMIHEGFISAYRAWSQKAEGDSKWAAENPFEFSIKKERGVISIYSPCVSTSQQQNS